MQGIGVRKPEKDFMTIRKVKFCFLFLILIGCKNDLSDDPIPFSPFNDVVIDLSFPELLNLVAGFVASMSSVITSDCKVKSGLVAPVDLDVEPPRPLPLIASPSDTRESRADLKSTSLTCLWPASFPAICNRSRSVALLIPE